MATVHGSWLQQGFFVLADSGLMPSVREELERRLNRPRGALRVEFFPQRAKWKHTYWWREGKTEYAEAQFFAQIAKAYPVLSLGCGHREGV